MTLNFMWLRLCVISQYSVVLGVNYPTSPWLKLDLYTVCNRNTTSKDSSSGNILFTIRKTYRLFVLFETTTRDERRLWSKTKTKFRIFCPPPFPVKFMGGVGEMSGSFLRLQPRTKPVIILLLDVSRLSTILKSERQKRSKAQ